MQEFFQEVEQDLAQEKTSKLIKRLAPTFVVVACLVIAGVGGFTWYRNNITKEQEHLSELYSAGLEILSSGGSADAIKIFSQVVADGKNHNYKALAYMQLAKIYLSDNKKEEAYKMLDSVINGKFDQTFRDLALLIKLSNKKNLLEFKKFAESKGQWKTSAKKILGSVSVDSDKAMATKYLNEIMADKHTPEAVKKQIDILLKR